MADIETWHDDDDDDLYTLPDNDPLGILHSTRAVMESGEHVWINHEQIVALSERWMSEENEKSPDANSNQWYMQYHFYDGTERTVNWMLVLDALNFCFWAEKNQPRWTIDYHDETLNGYWAEAAALTRAVEEGIPLWDAEYLSTISSETVAHIFRGTHTIPLFERRVTHMHEVGQVLTREFSGQFAYAIEQVEGSAVKLVQLLTQHFPSFRDVATYHEREVCFFKRAQICASDLHHAFNGQQWGHFTDLDQLTAFADYKLPQVLRHYNVIEYDAGLAKSVDNQQLLPAGSEEEVEIRAATIWACELLRRAMLQHGYHATAAEIDERLWFMGQTAATMRPYHRTRTIYY